MGLAAQDYAEDYDAGLVQAQLSASREAARILGVQEVTPASRGERRRLL